MDLDRHANRIPQFCEGAQQEDARAGALGDAQRVLQTQRIGGVPAGTRDQVGHLRTAQHADFGRPGKIGDHHVRQAFAQPVQFLSSGLILEIQNQNRIVSGDLRERGFGRRLRMRAKSRPPPRPFRSAQRRSDPPKASGRNASAIRWSLPPPGPGPWWFPRASRRPPPEARSSKGFLQPVR